MGRPDCNSASHGGLTIGGLRIGVPEGMVAPQGIINLPGEVFFAKRMIYRP